VPANFEAAFGRVKQLVADFRANESFYLSAQFSEAQARKDFIDKFLIALGWDVNHDSQKNPYEHRTLPFGHRLRHPATSSPGPAAENRGTTTQ
jgi:hypothetical protein